MIYEKIIDRVDFTRIKNVHSVKDRECQESEEIPQTERKYLQKQIFKGLLSKWHKEALKVNNMKTNNSVKTPAKDLGTSLKKIQW